MAPMVTEFNQPLRVRGGVGEQNQGKEEVYALVIGEVRLEQLGPSGKPVDRGVILVVIGSRYFSFW